MYGKWVLYHHRHLWSEMSLFCSDFEIYSDWALNYKECYNDADTKADCT